MHQDENEQMYQVDPNRFYGRPVKYKINQLELSIAMLRKEKTSHDLAKLLGRSRVSLDTRRAGVTTFSTNDIIAIAKELELSLQQVNEIFFDNQLLDGNK
ncbi:MAG: hypothetical protein FWG64_01890 [Firmicutes bacterium]|nr:hypothetical protein [Bacillota bacterium]